MLCEEVQKNIIRNPDFPLGEIRFIVLITRLAIIEYKNISFNTKGFLRIKKSAGKQHSQPDPPDDGFVEGR